MNNNEFILALNSLCYTIIKYFFYEDVLTFDRN